MKWWTVLLICGFILFGFGGQPAGAHVQADRLVYLPFLEHAPSPPAIPAARLLVTPDDAINASTFTPGAFNLSNDSPGSEIIVQARIDLRTAILPDLVFDPYGLAGDLVAKDLQIDAMPQPVGFSGHSYLLAHDGGYDILDLHFTDFGPGESVAFSVDVDPTSIRGAAGPGPNEAGSISGLEMAGATITISFANGANVSAQLVPIPGSHSGSEAVVRADLPPMPSVSVIGAPFPPMTVTEPAQLVRVSGPAGHMIRLVVGEGGLFTDGVPGGGFDLEPYELNSLVGVAYYTGAMNQQGFVDIPVTLTRSQANAGRNIITAALENTFGHRGGVAAPIILDLVE